MSGPGQTVKAIEDPLEKFEHTSPAVQRRPAIHSKVSRLPGRFDARLPRRIDQAEPQRIRVSLSKAGPITGDRREEGEVSRRHGQLLHRTADLRDRAGLAHAPDRRHLHLHPADRAVPEITPPQVQVTTTYTGADALTVAETVTTPIEQQINGVKGMIYFNSDSTSNGISTIVATFDVGYSQDIGAVDIQNRVETAQAVLPPEVKQFGVTIKKTSTDMVCVVNLVSPDGRYDSTYLDNYAQIYVLDSSEARARVSATSPCSGASMRCVIWLDPDRMAAQLISPTQVIQAIQSENRQAAAGKIGGQPIPPGQAF